MCAQRLAFKSLGKSLGPMALAAAVAGLAATPVMALGLWGSKPKPAAAAATQAKPGQPAAAAAPRKATKEQKAAADRLDPLARAAFWGREFQADPTDAEAGVALSAAMRAMGNHEDAAQTAAQVLVFSPKNPAALMESAKALIEAGRPFYAIEPLKQVQALNPKDWRPVSLLGVVYEQTERPEEAMASYRQALTLSPENPAVLSNMALMHAGRGETAQAETLLRRAVAQPASTIRERQNLALVLGLQGKLAEAEKLMRQDLPPETVNNNLDYFRTASAAHPATGRNWNALEGAQSARKP